MKVCFLADGLHPNTTSWIGHVARDLGHEVTLLTFGSKTPAIPGVRVLSIGRKARTSLRYLLWVPAVKRLLREIEPDVLVAYRVTSYGFMAACTGFRPLVLAAQGQHIAYGGSAIRAVFARFAIRRADLIHAWGSHMAEALRGLGAEGSKILTLPRGIDTSRFVPGSRPIGSAPVRIISTRGLNPDYNFDQILEAMALLAAQGQEFEYWMCGDGSYRAHIESRVAALGLKPYVRMLGRTLHDEVPERLRQSDIYVSAVISDGVSASLLEAMASGVFPIVTDNTANRLWVQHGVNGFLAPFGNAEALAELIGTAIGNRTLRRSAASMNREIVVERASVHANMKQFDAAWKALV